MYRRVIVGPGSSWERNDGWCGKEIGSENVEWIRLAQDGEQRHSNLQLKAMQFVVTACCIATRKVAELFRFSSARRSGGSGVQTLSVRGATRLHVHGVPCLVRGAMPSLPHTSVHDIS
jgi:hypothetical protein